MPWPGYPLASRLSRFRSYHDHHPAYRASHSMRPEGLHRQETILLRVQVCGDDLGCAVGDESAMSISVRSNLLANPGPCSPIFHRPEQRASHWRWPAAARAYWTRWPRLSARISTVNNVNICSVQSVPQSLFVNTQVSSAHLTCSCSRHDRLTSSSTR